MTKRVLVVDDETVISMAFKKLIQSPGVEVDIADTLEDVKTLLRENIYDVIIADLRLSGVSGREGLDIVHYVKERHPKTHVILITAYGNQEIMDKTYNLGAAFYFEKPVSGNMLKAALKNLGIE